MAGGGGARIVRCAAACALLAGCAQLPPPDTSEDVEVTLDSTEPKVALSLHRPQADPERDRPLLTCREPPCISQIRTGEYLLYAEAGRQTLSGSRRVRIDAPANIWVEPDSKSERTNGLALGVFGSAVFVLGNVMGAVGAEQADDGWDGFGPMLTGLAIAMAGASAAAPGWVIYGRSFAPKVAVTPRRVTAKPRLQEPQPSATREPCDTREAMEACRAAGGLCKYTGHGLACIRPAVPARPDPAQR